MRNRAAIVPKPSKQRSKRTNGKLVLDGRSARGRRLNDLIQAFSIGIDMSDEEARAAVVSTARLALAAEDLGDMLDHGEGDRGEYATLVNARDRGLMRLREMRAQARSTSGSAPGSAGSAQQTLGRHLHFLTWAKDNGWGDRPSSERQAELQAEHDRLEAAGAFASSVR
jgi:hypothetical protein